MKLKKKTRQKTKGKRNGNSVKKTQSVFKRKERKTTAKTVALHFVFFENGHR